MGIIGGLLLIIQSGSLKAQEVSSYTIEDYFSVVSMKVEDISHDGRWIAATRSKRSDRGPQDYTRYGDPTYIAPFRVGVIIIDSINGEQTEIFPEKRQVRALTWSPDGSKLAFFMKEEKDYTLYIWHRETEKLVRIPQVKNKPVAGNSPLAWSPDGGRLILCMRSEKWTETGRRLFKSLTEGPIIVHDGEDAFLPWDNLRNRRRLQIPAVYEPKAKKWIEPLSEKSLLSCRWAGNGDQLLLEYDISEKTDYEVIGGTVNRLEIRDLKSGESRILLDSYKQRRFQWSVDNKRFAWSEKGDVFVMGIEDSESRRLTGREEEPENANDDGKRLDYSVLRMSFDGKWILCSAAPKADEAEQSYRNLTPPPQYWLVDADTGSERLLYTADENPDERPELKIVDWSPDGKTIYFQYSSPLRYDRGLVKLDVRSGNMKDIIRGDHLYRGWRMSRSGGVFVFSDSDGDFPENWYSADSGFSRVRKLTDLNSHMAKKMLSHTELIHYRDADGRKLSGVLYYPSNYQKGKRYPMITEVYERYFDNGFNPTLNIFTAAGYAVLHPSVHLEKGYPGESWRKGALAAVNKVIEMGVADPDRLGIQGTSYGGYATVLLITQTDRFKAAVNNSGKVNMVSFYTQSPRLGVRNIHAPERSQDRIGGTLWEFPERYLDHSAILNADRIKTPLLCITGDQDPNVEAKQSEEIFYALRRLGKKVVWLRYHNGAHGGPHTEAERKDMYRRMLEWYDKFLKFE